MFLTHGATLGIAAAFGAVILSFTLFPAWDAVFFTRIALLCIALRLTLIGFEAYVRSRTYDTAGEDGGPNAARRLNYYASILWDAASRGRHSCALSEIAGALPRTLPGKIVLLRLGITRDAYRNALTNISGTDDAAAVLTEYASRHKGEITIGDIIELMSMRMEPLRQLIVASGLTAHDVREASSWVERALNAENRRMRWWTRESLGARQGIGKRWAYGRTFILNQFAQEWTGMHGVNDMMAARKKELDLLEASLLKESGANALLVGEPGSGKKTILASMAARIGRGDVFPALENKRVMMLSSSAVTGSGKTKGQTEALLLAILNEANRAGNIILAIDDFPEFVSSLSSLGTSAGQIFAPFLASSSLHLVALADTVPFRRVIAGDAGLLAFFETIHLGDLDRARISEILEDEAVAYEAKHAGKIIVTFSAIRAVADAALNTLTEGALLKRALDILAEATGSAAAAGDVFVAPAHVSRIVEQKTNMPSGAIGTDERTLLVNLEASLHRRVIGQDEAIRAIADTIRRARTAVRNPSRPIGSFLFLGPTGVGKTESAKALAAVYFGSEDAMMRYDCTEYQTEDDIAKLLGSPARNDPGILATRIRKTPYGVVLLDEFEKAHQQVRNVFLQILDEGFFSDYLGTRVNMRNTIIIATSNAGALLIQDLVKQGKNPAESREAVIEHIEKEAHMAPELLNRFDSLVIFRPLDDQSRRAIAELLLKKLAARLAQLDAHRLRPQLADQPLHLLGAAGGDVGRTDDVDLPPLQVEAMDVGR
ncbi:MAG: ATP-dependent Clp protease ATP-binding subunit, partial [Candidatus Sungbacteria bacterium]|nr:ATP-dependent Clp protease ATP-binding subunit [Candidatus Sungbacteria bacterium]